MGEFLWVILGLAFVIFMLCKEGYWEVIGCILGFVLTIAVIYWLIQANAILPAAILFLIVIIFLVIYIKVRNSKGWIAIRSNEDGIKLRKILSEQIEIPNFQFDDIFIDKIYTDKSSPFWTSAGGVPEKVSVQECYDWLCVRITEFLNYVGVDILTGGSKVLPPFLSLRRSKCMINNSESYPQKYRDYREERKTALIIEKYYLMKLLGLKYRRYDVKENKSDYDNYINANDLFVANSKYLSLEDNNNYKKCRSRLKRIFRDKYDIFLHSGWSKYYEEEGD